MERSFARTIGIALLTIAAPFASMNAQADTDWPQARGPLRDGVAAGDGLSTSRLASRWPAAGPRELWRQAIGEGFSAVAIDGGRLYTLAADAVQESVVCLDAATGRLLWSTPIGRRFANDFGDGPRATPTIDGDLVFAASGDAQLAALDTKDGSVLWTHDLTERFGGPLPRFGYSVSPLVDSELLILEVGGGEAMPAVVALDKRTGEQRWGALEGPASYSSPVVATFGGVRQFLFSRRAGQEVVALGTDGAVLWRHPGARAAIAMPLLVPPDRVFMSSADDDYGGVMLQVSRSTDGDWQIEELWSNHRMRNHWSNAVVAGGHLYGFDNATFRCLDLEDGSIKWSQRGFGKGSLVAWGDLLFVLGDAGILALVQANAETYTELGRVQAMQGRAWTSPALARGTIFLRDHDEVVAYDVSAAAKTDQRAAAIIDRYLEARGGAEDWRQAQRLSMHGSYAAFSQRNPFTLVRARPDRYRIDLVMLGNPAIRAKDGSGLWWQQPQLQIAAPARVDSGPFMVQLGREAIFGPALLDAGARGIAVVYEGEQDLDGTMTLTLAVTFPDGSSERWHLDPDTHREVMIESTVHDYTQGMKPMTQRAFFSDFREVQSLVFPHHIELEFGARLEVIEIESINVDPDLDAAAFNLPTASSPD